jgi:hypothetical protein
MKRAMSSFLLLILLLVAFQPTLVFHYCGGELSSVGLVKKESPKSCCGGENKNCCSNHSLKIATDDYQVQQQEITEIAPQLPVPAFFVSSDHLFSGEAFHSLVLHRIFPPGGSAGYSGADWLSLICVYRI